MVDTIKFNVSGFRYEEPKKLLETHPESLLFKTVSEQTSKNPNAEVFIDGDGKMFHFVIDYLKNEQVFLPITESRQAFMSELSHYGIDYNVDYISVTGEDEYPRSRSKVEDDTNTPIAAAK